MTADIAPDIAPDVAAYYRTHSDYSDPGQFIESCGCWSSVTARR